MSLLLSSRRTNRYK